jgi:hypothetical protein
MWVAKASMVCTATFDVASGFVKKNYQCKNGVNYHVLWQSFFVKAPMTATMAVLAPLIPTTLVDMTE